MKQILIFISCVLVFSTVKSQAKGRSEDKWSQTHYDFIGKSNQRMAPTIRSTYTVVNSFTSVIDNQYDELKKIHSQLKNLKAPINNFITNGSFNTTLGYNSYGYIKKKYPIINPFNPSDIARNKVIRSRFDKKLQSDKDKVDDYLDSKNPIPEGERILLVLTALEKVIHITLENETY